MLKKNINQDMTQWHMWYAWHPVFVPTVGKYGVGTWVWFSKLYRRRQYSGDERLFYWEYCLDDFELIKLQALAKDKSPMNFYSSGTQTTTTNLYSYGTLTTSNCVGTNLTSLTVTNAKIKYASKKRKKTSD